MKDNKYFSSSTAASVLYTRHGQFNGKMIEPTRTVTRKKCGKIFSANDILSLICEFCGDELQALEDFRSHLAEHFPESQPLISRGIYIEFVPAVIHEDLKNILTNDLQGTIRHNYL